MGCGSSDATAPGASGGAMNDDPDFAVEGKRMRFDKKTGGLKACDEGKDDDGPQDDFFEVEEAQGEQFMAVRPWIGQIQEPDQHNENDPTPPDCSYELEYVYGYRCEDSWQNIHFNCEGKPVYMTAALGVILDTDSNTQKFFGGGEVENTAKNRAKDNDHHTDDILALKMCPERKMAVSGQVGASPTIFVWDACTGQKQCRIKIGKGARGICAVDINAEGQVCAADLHNDHNVYCFDKSGNAESKDKGGPDKIKDICWDAKPGSKRYMTAGVKHIKFWEGAEQKKGLFNGHKMTSFACCAFDNNGIGYTGAGNGDVYVWEDRTCEFSCNPFEGKKSGFISAIQYADGKMFVGSKYCGVGILDNSNPTKGLPMTKSFGFDSIVRAIDCLNDCLVVGQRDGTISMIKNGGTPTDIMKSHSDGEVWGLTRTSDGTVVTSGDDNKVMFWNPDSRTAKQCVKASDRKKSVKRGASTMSNYPDSQCSRAVAVNDTWMAIGSNDGPISIRNCSDPNTECHLLSHPKEWTEVMAFSPDGQWLAVGNHDNNIYIYSVGDWSLKGTCKGHTSYIMALDWCAHSKYIRSNCGAYELLFFTIPECEQDPSGRTNTTSVVWSSVTCKFLWETQGIYPSGTDGTHINSVCSTPDKTVLATGDDYGLVNLFRNPCLQGGKPKSLRGHSEHVVRVMFNDDCSRLFSVGGYDQTLMQWKRC